MEALQIINGLSDIKTELIRARGLSKNPNDLGLWFFFEDNILYVHDSDAHGKNKVIAMWSGEIIKIYLRGLSSGYRLAEHVIGISKEKSATANVFNAFFREYGYLPPRV